MTADELARAVGVEAAAELTVALAKIKHCVEQLNEGYRMQWQPLTPEQGAPA